jgi:hypothetical protein
MSLAAGTRIGQSVVVSLPGTLQLRENFNDRHTERRVLSLVSPTCDQCLAGLKLVMDEIGGTSDVAIFVLWVSMLAGDTPEVARRVANGVGVDGGTMRHYWEGEGLASLDPCSLGARHRSVRSDAERLGCPSVSTQC